MVQFALPKNSTIEKGKHFPSDSKSKKLKSRLSFYRDGFLVAGLSPKAIIFFGTIFSSFIDFSGNYFAQFIILMTTYVILDFATLMIYGIAADKISVWLKSNPKTLNTISACVLLIIALEPNKISNAEVKLFSSIKILSENKNTIPEKPINIPNVLTKLNFSFFV